MILSGRDVADYKASAHLHICLRIFPKNAISFCPTMAGVQHHARENVDTQFSQAISVYVWRSGQDRKTSKVSDGKLMRG